jgi:hypothetical protein
MWPFGEEFDAEKMELFYYFKDIIKSKIKYIYDFGDDWLHEITLDFIDNDIILHPKCIAGKGKAPVEDCGGINGFYHMVETINSGPDIERKEYLEWLEEDDNFIWDKDEFDLQYTNERLIEVWRILTNK